MKRIKPFKKYIFDICKYHSAFIIVIAIDVVVVVVDVVDVVVVVVVVVNDNRLFLKPVKPIFSRIQFYSQKWLRPIFLLDSVQSWKKIMRTFLSQGFARNQSMKIKWRHLRVGRLTVLQCIYSLVPCSTATNCSIIRHSKAMPNIRSVKCTFTDGNWYHDNGEERNNTLVASRE